MVGVSTLRHYKLCVVERGDQEEHDIRSDFPTADFEAQRLMLAITVVSKLRVRSDDIDNANC